MHEISLVRTIFRTLEDNFTKEELQNMTEIDLKVGKLSNVEPILMQSAFEAVTQSEQRYESVKLNIHLTSILVHCEPCNLTNEIENYKFVCACGKPSRNIIQGTELLIEKVHFL
ncbi:MAG: hydrogenase maturation nickel metallochaperone HypA [Microscillaceae bacterium]|nr:hydrogenase maturation nickel metallochaperone HypA [Microscillaceae bacterium]